MFCDGRNLHDDITEEIRHTLIIHVKWSETNLFVLVSLLTNSSKLLFDGTEIEIVKAKLFVFPQESVPSRTAVTKFLNVRHACVCI